MPCPDYREVTRLVRAAFVEYRRVDPEGDRDTFADFVNDVTGDEAFRFIEQRVSGWPPGEARVHAERLIGLHRAMGASLAALMALLPEPEPGRR